MRFIRIRECFTVDYSPASAPHARACTQRHCHLGQTKMKSVPPILHLQSSDMGATIDEEMGAYEKMPYAVRCPLANHLSCL